jgi:hypothetical protein
MPGDRTRVRPRPGAGPGATGLVPPTPNITAANPLPQAERHPSPNLPRLVPFRNRTGRMPPLARIPCPPGPLLKVVGPSPLNFQNSSFSTSTAKPTTSAALVLHTSVNSSFVTLNAKAPHGLPLRSEASHAIAPRSAPGASGLLGPRCL